MEFGGVWLFRALHSSASLKEGGLGSFFFFFQQIKQQINRFAKKVSVNK
jgi:hypothetical protein